MQVIEQILTAKVASAIRQLYGQDCTPEQIQLQKTRREFEGDITLVVFPLLIMSRKSPDVTAVDIGGYLQDNCKEIVRFTVFKGFLNLVVADNYYVNYLNFAGSKGKSYGKKRKKHIPETVVVEYSSPNTNKPLHLGHIRNNLLGFSVSNILKARGYNVIRTNLVNDRGIHICKSMLAWQKWGKGETPKSSKIKGDHLVGKYYVLFDNEFKKQVSELIAGGSTQEEAEKKAPLIVEAQEMLRNWEAGDKDVRKLWRKMNKWVYKGFAVTYQRLGIYFDSTYYESKTWIEGKKSVLKGEASHIFDRQLDSSIWVNLENVGLDNKLLLRSDGTSVYITQDIGTAKIRQKKYLFDKMVYVVGNEQNYHFKVLAHVLESLGFSAFKSLHHLSYGMVELPEGKMKSREGKVVDADELMDEMIDTAREMSKELGKLEGLNESEKDDIFRIIGLGALKYFMLKVDPIKNMLFNPRESIDFNGNTGPFLQYTYTRIRSVFRKAIELKISIPDKSPENIILNDKEKNLLKLIHEFPMVVRDAGETFNPSLIANFIYELVKEFNQFYHDYSILKEENPEIRKFRLVLSQVVSGIVKNGMELLGIEMPERM